MTVTVYGAQATGLTIAGDIYYRVVDSAPENAISANGFDPTGWTNAGSVPSFTVRNAENGRFIEVVQVVSETVYTIGDNGEPVASGVKYTVVKHGGTLAETEEVPGFTVSGQLIPDDVKADMEGAVLVLTDAADSSVTYTATVTVADGVASYAFADVISGTYILNLDPSVIKISSGDTLITVDRADESRNIDVNRVILPGDINSDYLVDNRDLTRLFQYLTDWDVEVEEKTLDVNGDGEINNKDLTRLYQYLSGWEVEIY